jgi:hypothetical protein
MVNELSAAKCVLRNGRDTGPLWKRVSSGKLGVSWVAVLSKGSRALG